MKENRDISLTPDCKTTACLLSVFLSVCLWLPLSESVGLSSLHSAILFLALMPLQTLKPPWMKPERAGLTHSELPRHITLWGSLLYLFFFTSMSSLMAGTLSFLFCQSPESCSIDKCSFWVTNTTVWVKILCKLKCHVIIGYFVVFIQGSLYCILALGLLLLKWSSRPGEKLKIIFINWSGSEVNWAGICKSAYHCTWHRVASYILFSPWRWVCSLKRGQE